MHAIVVLVFCAIIVYLVGTALGKLLQRIIPCPKRSFSASGTTSNTVTFGGLSNNARR